MTDSGISTTGISSTNSQTSIWKPNLNGLCLMEDTSPLPPPQPTHTSRETDIRRRETLQLYSKNVRDILTFLADRLGVCQSIFGWGCTPSVCNEYFGRDIMEQLICFSLISQYFNLYNSCSQRIPELNEFFYTPVLHLKYNFENKRKLHQFILRTTYYLFNRSFVVEHDLVKLS